MISIRALLIYGRALLIYHSALLINYTALLTCDSALLICHRALLICVCVCVHVCMSKSKHCSPAYLYLNFFEFVCAWRGGEEGRHTSLGFGCVSLSFFFSCPLSLASTRVHVLSRCLICCLAFYCASLSLSRSLSLSLYLSLTHSL